MKKAAILLGAPLTLILLYLFFRTITAPVSTPAIGPAYDPALQPEQIDSVDSPLVNSEFSEGTYALTPKATYRLSAKICGKQKYRRPWQSFVAPYDLCLAWGDLAVKDTSKWIRFSQDMRWYQFLVKRDAPWDVTYVSQHSANTHVIPATKNLAKAVSRLSKGDLVELTGDLVYLDGTWKGVKIWWHSSLKREDDGAGACEVLYLTTLRLKDRRYR